jgi:hypothetical protein
MMRRLRARGDGKIGCVLWLLAFLIAGLIAWKMIPVKIASSQLYDYMEDEAKFAAGNTVETLKKRILQKAVELRLPVKEENVTVEKPGDNIRMRCIYSVPVEFPGYTYVWHFDHQVNRPIYIF